MTAVEKIEESVKALSPEERDQLIESLIAAREKDQVNEIGRRIDEVRSGAVELIPGSVVMAELDKQLHG